MSARQCLVASLTSYSIRIHCTDLAEPASRPDVCRCSHPSRYHNVPSFQRRRWWPVLHMGYGKNPRQPLQTETRRYSRDSNCCPNYRVRGKFMSYDVPRLHPIDAFGDSHPQNLLPQEWKPFR